MAMRRLRVGLQSVYQPASEKKAGGRSHPIMSSYASSTPREHVNLDEPYRPKPLGEKSHGPPKNSILVDVDTTPTTPKLQHTTATRAVNTGRRPPTRKPRAANPVAAAIVSEAKSNTDSSPAPLSPRGPSPRTASTPVTPAPTPDPVPSSPRSPTAEKIQPPQAQSPDFVAAAVPREKRRTRIALSSYLVGDAEKGEKDRKAAESMRKSNVINLGQKQVMRVFLEDGTMKTLQVPIPCAVHELVDLMKQKQKLTDVSEYGIYEFHDKTEIKQLPSNDDLKTVLDNGTQRNALFRLVFKKSKVVVSSLDSLIKQFPEPPDYIPAGENTDIEEELYQELTIPPEPSPSTYTPSATPPPEAAPPPSAAPPPVETTLSPSPSPQNNTASSFNKRPVNPPTRPARTATPPTESTPPPSEEAPQPTTPINNNNRPPVPVRSVSAKNVNTPITTTTPTSPKPSPLGGIQSSVSMMNVVGGPVVPRPGAPPQQMPQDRGKPPPQQGPPGGSGAKPSPGPGRTSPGPGAPPRGVAPSGPGTPRAGAPASPQGNLGGSGGTAPSSPQPGPGTPRGGVSPLKPPTGGGGVGSPRQPPPSRMGPPTGVASPTGNNNMRPPFAKPSPGNNNNGGPPQRPQRDSGGGGGGQPLSTHQANRMSRPPRRPSAPSTTGGGSGEPVPSGGPAQTNPSSPVSKGPPPARPQRNGPGLVSAASAPLQRNNPPSLRPKGPPSASGGVSSPVYEPGPAKEEVLRIFFKDGTFRSIVVQNTSTAKNLFDAICSKFKDADLSDHALFHLRASQQRKLEENEYVLALTSAFSSDADRIQFKHRDDVVVLQKKVVRVYFTDNTFKSYQITSEDTVLDVVHMVAKKLNVPASNNALYQMKGDQVSSRLDDTDNAWEVQENWEDGTIFVFASAPPVMKTGFVAEPEDTKPLERTTSTSFRPSYLMNQSASSLSMARLAKESVGNVQLRKVATPIERKHWDSMQSRAFTQWFDWHVAKRDYFIQDLEHDICDGVLLVNLLEILSGYDLGAYHDKPQMLISEKLENVTKCFEFMNEIGLPVRGCGPEDIIDGNGKLILGLLWPLIFLSAVSPFDPRNVNEASAKKELLSWCQSTVNGYQGVKIDNFDSSWQDGLGFCALISKFAPNLLDYGSAVGQGKDRITMFLGVVDQLGIPPILVAQDLQSQFRPDERSIFSFLLVLRERLTNM